MKFAILLLSLFVTIIVISGFFFSITGKKNLKATRFLASFFTENQGPERVLSIGLYGWVFFFYLSMGTLLFVSVICFFYTVALIHGEIYLLLDAIGPTAGNIAVHLIYPIEIFLFAILILVLFLGSTQIFTGPIEPMSKLHLKIDGISDMCRKMINILLVILLLELTKTAIYSLLVTPDEMGEFFSSGATPMMKPVGLAVLVGMALVLGGTVIFRLKSFNNEK